jgi:hypothetical protein
MSNAEKVLKKDVKGNLSTSAVAKVNHSETFAVNSTAVVEVCEGNLGG